MIPTLTVKVTPHAGVRKTTEGMIKFGRIFPDNFNKVSFEEMGKDIVKEAQRKAKRSGSTSFLSKSIKLGKRTFGKRRSTLNIVASARYAAAQEFGYGGHWIPIEYIEQHLSNPGVKGQKVQDPRGYAWVQRHKPYLAPAIALITSNLERYATKAVNKSLRDSKLR